MRFHTAFCTTLVAAGALFTITPTFAQTEGQAQLRLVVVDQTDAGLPTATVTVTAPGAEPASVVSDDRGVAMFPALGTGSAKIHVEFPGFDPYVGTFTVKPGQNNHTVTLVLGGLSEEVVVTAAASPEDRRGNAMVTTLEEADVAALPDDPEELESVLTQMAGPGGAVFQVNGFRGGRLPAKEEIRMIRFRMSSFSADNHDAGRTQVEIITRPNVQNWSGGANLNVRSDTLNARNAFARVETPEENRRAGFSLRGPLTSKTSVRFSTDGNRGFNSGTIIALGSDGQPLGQQVRQPFEQTNITAGLEHALTGNQTLRFEYRHGSSESSNQGVGDFNLQERASSRNSSDDQVRFQLQGMVNKTMLNELRVQIGSQRNEASSVSDDTSIVVIDAFSRGGAGVSSRSATRTFEIADNLDFTVARKHQMRVGLLLEGAHYSTFDARNAAGTFTFGSLESYLANEPLQYTQRLGTVDTSFAQYQFGVYWQDDFTVGKNLSLSLGLRNEMQSHIDDRLNLMPRLGFTLTPWGTRTSIRGGYGLFNDWYEASLHEQTLRVDGVSQRDLLIINPGYPNPYDGGDAIVLPSGRIQADPDLKMPAVHQASLGVERQIAPNVTMQASYQMLRGYNQIRARNVNAPVDGVRPEAGVGTVTQFESTGRSESDRLTVQTNYRNQQRRLLMNVSYTLGRANNYSDGASALPADSLNPDAEWGPSVQDIRHQVNAMASAPLFFGVRSTIQFQARSGAPYTMTTGRDDNLDGVVNDRPEGVGRNTLRGDATWDLGLRIGRAFGFGGPRATPAQGGQQGRGQGGGGRLGLAGAENSRYSVELFANVTNLFNHVNYLGYSGNVLSPFFGQPTRAGQARRIETGLQFRF